MFKSPPIRKRGGVAVLCPGLAIGRFANNQDVLVISPGPFDIRENAQVAYRFDVF